MGKPRRLPHHLDFRCHRGGFTYHLLHYSMRYTDKNCPLGPFPDNSSDDKSKTDKALKFLGIGGQLLIFFLLGELAAWILRLTGN